ncbi:Hypothetical protein SMAX5B_019554 [Scophthalmus maximus]|uniref:Uncharacterized protein n=1 Tax=Scophthalmus maximus TaxID=52904 RepID=A0A2U9C2Q5_SCOMX|nr:Hypothetical protein SMAX5B_019554 [Scophthalmus maximus]
MQRQRRRGHDVVEGSDFNSAEMEPKGSAMDVHGPVHSPRLFTTPGESVWNLQVKKASDRKGDKNKSEPQTFTRWREAPGLHPIKSWPQCQRKKSVLHGTNSPPLSPK